MVLIVGRSRVAAFVSAMAIDVYIAPTVIVAAKDHYAWWWRRGHNYCASTIIHIPNTPNHCCHAKHGHADAVIKPPHA